MTKRRYTRAQVVLARIAVALIVGLAAMGLLRNGFSADVRERLFQSMIDRPGGPMTFRFVLQPAMAALMAAIDGMRDARIGDAPYLTRILTDRERRLGALSEGIVSTARILLLALGMDVVCQVVGFGTFYPGEAAVIAVLLGFAPYLILRGPFARIARWWLRRGAADKGTR